MSTNQIKITYYSANDQFKAQYKKVLRWSLLAALLLTSLGVWLTPAYHPKPYVLRDAFIIEDYQFTEEIELPEEPLIKAPVIVREIVAVTNGEDDEIELPNPFEYHYFPPVTGPLGVDHLDKFSPVSSKPVLLHFAKPDYPEIARLSKLEGVVIIKALVGADGSVKQTVVMQGVHPLLDKAAAVAARRCRFKAGSQRTIPVRAWVAIPYSFRLK